MKENCYKYGKSRRCSANAENECDERTKAANSVMVLGCIALTAFLILALGTGGEEKEARYYANAENEGAYSVFAPVETDDGTEKQKNTLLGRIAEAAGEFFGAGEYRQ